MKQSITRVALLVREYDEAIDYYVNQLGFTLVEDTPVETQNKRWVVVTPPGYGDSQLLLARAVFVRSPRDEPYGTVAVFRDLYGNLWDPGAGEVTVQSQTQRGKSISAPASSCVGARADRSIDTAA
ncbi:MAG TPA: VOC family protein [Steroidobacteraceae bacterium]|jgi:catechol 2,3-dioxygenase-like lactoylglutathione lyase family enzyme|nr:VOC family protein [Steroidobacteraceae bacterium]